MANKKSFYFRQRVSDAELNAAFDDFESADHALVADLGFIGVLANAVVSPHAPVPNLTVDVSGPGIALDQLGRRLFFSGLQTVNVAQDDNGVATNVSVAGKDKVVSIFLRFDRVPSDPRIDGHSSTVFFRQDEGFKFVVMQGAEAEVGNAVPPALRADAILLADVVRRFGQAQINADAISTARRQDAFVLAGAPRAIRRGRPIEAVADLLGFYNAHVGGTADRHPAAAIDYAGGNTAWADDSQNPATTVEAQLDKIVADLAGQAGAAKIGAAATAGAPTSLVAGSMKSQLDALLGFFNAHVMDPDGAHAATAIAYGGGPTWRDGTANGAATVETQLDALVAALAADAGATRLGTPARPDWLDGTANPPASIFEALAKLVTDLAAQTIASDGAARVGARAVGHLAAGSVRSQLDALDATSVRTNVANAFTATQTLNGAAGDLSAALTTTLIPLTRKLLWEIRGPSVNYRIYAALTAIELTVNAKWNGTQWVKDLSAAHSTKFQLSNSDLKVLADDGLKNPFDDAWLNSITFALNGLGQTFDAGGNWVSPGRTETYAGAFGAGGTTLVGASASFRKVFPATPSSLTFTLTSQVGVVGAPAAIATTPIGTGVFVTMPSGTGNFFCRILAS
ncbi:MAG TPA: hypothetical protein VFP84_10515 [Kofleriaceae bacterium]|nr:hypothetical protein [Kofleriaceae bacterium]